MERLQSFCRACANSPAVDLCLCTFPVVPLCQKAECRAAHKPKNGLHFFVPWGYFENLSSLEQVQRLRLAMSQVRVADEWFISQFSEFERCENELTAKCSAFVREIEHQLAEAKRRLQLEKEKLRREIKKGKAELLSHLYDGSYQPSCETANIYRNFIWQQMDDCKKLLVWRVEDPTAEHQWLHFAMLLGDRKSKAAVFTSHLLCLECFEKHDFTMECGHSLCRKCFFKHISVLKFSIVTTSGLSSVSCPYCFRRISTATLHTALGDQLGVYLQQAREITIQERCSRCKRVLPTDRIRSANNCACVLCVHCRIELVQQSLCFCGEYFAPSKLAALSHEMEACAFCHKEATLQSFAALQCADHTICISCLKDLLRDSDPRCPIDGRVFTAAEVEKARKVIRRPCDLCGENAIEMIRLPCDCYHCCNCIQRKSFSSKLHIPDNCCTCHERLPNSFKEEYQRFFCNALLIGVKPATHCPPCGICMNRVYDFASLRVCNEHSFHDHCLEEYLANFFSTIVTRELTCPVAGCKAVFHLEQYKWKFGDQLCRDYSRLLEAANTRTVACPVCNSANSSKDIGPNTFISCRVCENFLCGMCGRPSEEIHGFKQCKFTVFQRHIQELEVWVGEEDTISQCPRCKVPYRKKKDYEAMWCPTSGCVEWCFQCSALMSPINAHNGRWHRPQCPKYLEVDSETESTKWGCSECMRLGRLCDPPQNLKVRGRFDIDEYL